MKADINVTMTYPHPADRVWEALTSSDALASWLMPNDFKPVVGHRFTFQARPFRAMGFDGTVRCEVLELDPPKRMVWSWAGGALVDTTVTFTLEPTADGTRLRMHQTGFDGLGGQLTRRILAGGYPRILGQRLPAYLDQAPGSQHAAAPYPAHCAHDGRRWLPGALRRANRQIQSR